MKTEMQIVKSYTSSLPVDIIGLIEELGILYQEYPMDEGCSGRIDINDPFFTITVNSRETPQRKRFTAAHELAHYLLHRDLLDDGEGHFDRLFVGRGEENPYEPFMQIHEVQANRFAADLLMPAGPLARMYDPVQDNVRELANRCHVSLSALKIRLNSLNLRKTAV